MIPHWLKSCAEELGMQGIVWSKHLFRFNAYSKITKSVEHHVMLLLLFHPIVFTIFNP